VTRRSRSGDIIGPTQRVPVLTALKAMTIWPAYQYFEENQKGSLEVGKLADLVILSADPTTVDPETLFKLKVLETIKEGQAVYAADTKQENKTELIWPSDRINTGFHEMLRQVFVMRAFNRLPAAYQTAQARIALEESFDDCGEGLILADLLGLEQRGPGLASK